jgi:hypothetical protein
MYRGKRFAVKLAPFEVKIMNASQL